MVTNYIPCLSRGIAKSNCPALLSCPASMLYALPQAKRSGGYKAKQSQVVVHEDRKAKCHLRLGYLGCSYQGMLEKVIPFFFSPSILQDLTFEGLTFQAPCPQRTSDFVPRPS